MTRNSDGWTRVHSAGLASPIRDAKILAPPATTRARPPARGGTPMHPRHHRTLAAALLALCAAAGSARAQATQEQGDAAAVARAQADSLRHPWTAADARFMSHMIGHHAQALVMARWAPSHGAGPAILRLAQRIINAQED